MQERQFNTPSFALVTWLAGRGFMPLRAVMAGDGSGKVIYVFSPDAFDIVNEFYDLKSHLNQLALEARCHAGDNRDHRNTSDRNHRTK
jgi:hypothetical protein